MCLNIFCYNNFPTLTAIPNEKLELSRCSCRTQQSSGTPFCCNPSTPAGPTDTNNRRTAEWLARGTKRFSFPIRHPDWECSVADRQSKTTGHRFGCFAQRSERAGPWRCSVCLKRNCTIRNLRLVNKAMVILTPYLERALAAATANVLRSERDLNWDSVTWVSCKFLTSSGEKCSRMVCGWLNDVPFEMARNSINFCIELICSKQTTKHLR